MNIKNNFMKGLFRNTAISETKLFKKIANG